MIEHCRIFRAYIFYVQVELEPWSRALGSPFTNHSDSDPIVDDNPNLIPKHLD